MEKWRQLWKIKMNPTKCEVIRFAKGRTTKHQPNLQLFGTTLPSVTQTKYLGVTLDSQLSWKFHIIKITSKANAALAKIRSLIRFNSDLKLHLKVLLYKSFIRPILTYASPIWFPFGTYSIRRLTVFQNKDMRRMTKAHQFQRNL